MEKGKTEVTRRELLIEECRRAAIKAAGGTLVRDSSGEIIFDAEDWTPTAEDMEWVSAQSADPHRDGICHCAEMPCTQGHPGADGGHCECGE